MITSTDIRWHYQGWYGQAAYWEKWEDYKASLRIGSGRCYKLESAGCNYFTLVYNADKGYMVGLTNPIKAARKLRSVRATLPYATGWVGRRWAATCVW